MDPKAHHPRKCEICGMPLFSGTETRCQRCLGVGMPKRPDAMPDRSPIMAKPDTRYALPDARPEYDGTPDPELPTDTRNMHRRGRRSFGCHTAGRCAHRDRAPRYDPSAPAYKGWLRCVLIWAAVTAVLTALCIRRGHIVFPIVWTVLTAAILGFCTPNRYMQEEFVPAAFLFHRISRGLLVLLTGGVPSFAVGWLIGWLLGKII